ncbi:MAG: glycosyltransferase family 2 protein [Eubacterium sp.]|nr:glycosyltransferase family 2 protein [Eubacterium sp.]
MDNLGEAYCNLGMELFEAGEYERSVQNLIKAFEAGYRKEDILEHLYACLVLPNEDEFRNNYSVNCLEISQLPYENLSLDFIPVSERKFYIFDREQQKFQGIFELEEEPVQGKETEFQSVLYTDLWDIREVLSDWKEREWDTVYLVLNELEPKFASFLKLPRFKELYLQKVVAFKNERLMYAFFEYYNEFYLPKTLISSQSQKYLSLIKELHGKRIHCAQKERKNIFLSVCIPSYNRGSVALANVKRILQCPYDMEVEVVVSNNGSTKDTEGYQEISEMDDARIKYHEFSENQGYATNVIKVLEMAGGDYAVIASDEDFIILEHLQEFLSYIRANMNGGLFVAGGIGPNMRISQNIIHKSGSEAITAAMNLNYITGITYNMKLLHEIDAFRFIASMRGNRFLEPYVHMVFAMLAGKYADFHKAEILLWDARDKTEPGQEKKNGILSYMFPENRIIQCKEVLEILQKGLLVNGEDFISFFLERFQKTYYLLQLAYTAFEDLKRNYTWEDICFYLYRENMKYINEFPFMLTVEGKERLQELAKEIFLEYLCREALLSGLSPEERRKKEVLHQLIKIELEGYGGSIIKSSYRFLAEFIGKEESFLLACEEEAVTHSHIIAYLHEMYWKDVEAKKNMDIEAWDA